MKQIEQGRAHVTTDAEVARLFPEHDPQEALHHAELHAVLLSRRSKRDHILDLRHQGKITTPEMKAAHEIALIVQWQAGEHRPIVRSQFSERLAATTAGCALWLVLMEAEGKQFARWKLWGQGFPLKPERTLYDLTIAVVGENYSVGQVGKGWHMDRRRVLALLRRSLSFYACAAGHLPCPEPVEIAP